MEINCPLCNCLEYYSPYCYYINGFTREAFMDLGKTEDIFVLYHYIQGNLSGYIYKLFPDREQSRLKRLASDNRPSSLVNQSDMNSIMASRNPEATPGEVNDDFNATMISFCREVLTEMRINCDKLAEDIR